jgi:hypothetical protein
VLLDFNAGGFGWFIDLTPADDSEFAFAADAAHGTAPAGSPAYGQMDLLTVVMHELGHVLGLADLVGAEYADDLMAETLVPGARRLPAAAQTPVLHGDLSDLNEAS